jgi:hypothetical protein
MDLNAIKMDITDVCHVIFGHTHSIKTAEDLYEIIATVTYSL